MSEGLMMKVIEGETLYPPPLWMMRQAGRYLPEYKQIRQEAESFLELCYNPKWAMEATLQPMRRFALDAAIVFSDILVVPDAMGRKVKFEERIGPVLEGMSISDISQLEKSLNVEAAMNHLQPVFETLKLVSGELRNFSPVPTLLGFCGAPWTVACYMVNGRSSPDQSVVRDFAFKEPEAFQSLMEVLTDVSISYLIKQLDAGADAVQIFDSWAFVLDEEQFNKWCVAPVRNIVAGVRAKKPEAKIIGFPRGVGALYETYRGKTGVDMLSLDWTVPVALARKLQEQVPIQGNLDPRRLAIGGECLEQGVRSILENLGEGPLVFNLGHGILPNTPIENVEAMIAQVRNYKGK